MRQLPRSPEALALSVALSAVATAMPCVGQGLEVGDPAPAIALDSWLNLPGNEKPTLKNQKGKVVLIEFWGTW